MRVRLCFTRMRGRFLVPLALGAVALGNGVVCAATFEELAAQATAARQENKFPEALGLYRSALAMNPGWAEGWWFVGRLSYDADQYAGGQEAFSRYVKLKEQDGGGWAFLGLCEFETGHYEESLDHLRRSLTMGLGHSQVEAVLHFHIALLLTRLGLFDQAVAEYTPFAHRGAREPALIAGMGLAALRRPLLPREVPASEQAVVNSAGETAYLWMAGDTSKAEASFQSLLIQYPDAPGVHYF